MIATKRSNQNDLLITIIIVLTATAVAANQFKVPTIMGNITTSLQMNDSSGPWLMFIFTFVGIFLALPTGRLATYISKNNKNLLTHNNNLIRIEAK